MGCSFCQSESFVKNGIVRGVQRYKCKECSRNFTEMDHREYPVFIKHLLSFVSMKDKTSETNQTKIKLKELSNTFQIPEETISDWLKDPSYNDTAMREFKNISTPSTDVIVISFRDFEIRVCGRRRSDSV